MKLFYSIAVLLLALSSGCKKDEPAAAVVVPAPPPPPVAGDTSKAKTFLALGDSYTIGQSVAVEDRFPNQTTSLLAGENIQFNTANIIAQTGWTTGNLLARLQSTPPVNIPYDIVTLLIGVNNQYQRSSQALYRNEFTLLLNQAIGYAGNRKPRVFVLSIPDYSVTPFGNNDPFIARQIDSFNVINKEITLATGCNYIDITGSTRQAKNDPSLVAGDGLHPSGKEYRKWALMLYPLIKAAVQ